MVNFPASYVAARTSTFCKAFKGWPSWQSTDLLTCFPLDAKINRGACQFNNSGGVLIHTNFTLKKVWETATLGEFRVWKQKIVKTLPFQTCHLNERTNPCPPANERILVVEGALQKTFKTPRHHNTCPKRCSAISMPLGGTFNGTPTYLTAM